jgi:serine protease
MRPVHSVLVVAVAGTCIAWPASVAFSTGVMTPKQAKLAGLTATHKVREQVVDKLIVRVRPVEFDGEPKISNSRVQALSTVAGARMTPLRRLASGSHLMRLDRPMTVSEARAMAARLVRDGGVQHAEPDILFKKVAIPNEPRFTQWQWNLFAPATMYSSGSVTVPATGGANLPGAWDLTNGSGAVTIAIIDTGITNHTDLNGISGGATYTPAGRFLPGYDFVSSDIGTGLPLNFIANDGNGRDADPSDPGDWITAGDHAAYPTDCDAISDSTWHGTHMAGVAAATANNAVGIAGIGWNVRLLPVRALGKCGGSLSDIADAIRWAAGAQPESGTWQSEGVTVGTNPHPAQVISLSLGGDTSCSPEMKGAVEAAHDRGAVIVAATGNDGVEGLISPAICEGVIAVTAHAINGENADYANIASATAPKTDMLSAPGGGPPVQLGSGSAIDNDSFNGYYIHSTVLFGATTPISTDGSGSSGPAYSGFVGTSPATPHVAGVAALIKSISPEATAPQIRSFLMSNVRPYPAGSACAAGGQFVGRCGAGLLDAERALQAVPNALPFAVAGADQVAVPGSTVTLDGSSSKALSGKVLTAYEWSQTAGTPTVTLATPNAATTTFTAPASGTLTFRLRVTDSQSKTGDDSVVVRVNNPPVAAAPPAAQSVPAGAVVSFTVTGSDADGDALTFVATAGSTVPFNALAPSGQFSWNTAGFPPGNYQLVYFATDGVTESAAQTVPITVAAVAGR